MAGKAQSIKASEAYVTIRADEGNLPQVIDAARKRAKDFAGSVGQIGDKISGKFGASITNAIVGFAAVSAFDAGLEEISTELKEWMNGESKSAWDFGAAFGKGIADGLRSVPIAGVLGEMLSFAFDPLLGSPLAMERNLEQVAQERMKVQAVFAEIASQIAGFDQETASGGDPNKLAALQVAEEVSRAVNALRTAGMTLEQARAAANGVQEAFDRMMNSRADKAFEKITDELRDMRGEISADERELRAFEDRLKGLRGVLEATGVSEAESLTMTNELLDQFKEIQSQRAAKSLAAETAKREQERINDVLGLLDKLRERVLEANTDESYRIQLQLEDLGATQQQIDEAMALIAQLDGLDAERKALSAASPQFEQSFVGTFNPAALEFGSDFGGIENASKQTARNTLRIAQAVERNQLAYGN